MNSVVESSASDRRQALHHSNALTPNWVRSFKEAARAASSEDNHAVWIVKKEDLVNWVAHTIAVVKTPKRAGYLFLVFNARPALIPALEKRFTAVAFAPDVLPRDELQEVCKLPDRRDRFIGGIVDKDSRTITLWRGNFESMIVPFDAFPPTANGIRPDFKKFSVIEYGQTLKFGDYESDSAAVLYEFASDFRKRLKQARFAEEQTLGASIRRLRRQRRLTRGDFKDVDSKTIARIEMGTSKTPRASTLEAIAATLGVKRDELSDY